MANDFVHLHVHTYYSILDGASSIPKLVDKAVADGMRGLAITDHGDMFGIKEFWDYVKGVNKKRKADGLEPFKPILGCEMYVAKHDKEDKVKDHGDMSGAHLIVLAKNKTGYKNLIKIVSDAWQDGFYMRPRTDHKALEAHHEGLIICSACLAGEVPRAILRDDIRAARETIEWYQRVFGDDYYLEIQRHEVKDPTIRANREAYPAQRKVNKVIMELAKEYGVKVVCSNDVHFVDQDDAEAHDHLLCISTKEDLDAPDRMLYSKQEWFKTRAEMESVFGDVPEAMANTVEILDKVEQYSIEHDALMPFFPIPETFGTERQLRERMTEAELVREFCTDENGENPLSDEEADKRMKHLGGIDRMWRIKFEADYLAHLTGIGAKRLYGDPLPDDVVERIRFELHVMKTMGFPGYFLIVQDFINAARNELDVWVGPGRGSAAGSVVAYCLGITNLDPLKYALLFERFLNPDRVSLPDIDTDFEDEGRGKVLKWVTNKYGVDNCAHIITYGTMATKNSIKDVARVEGKGELLAWSDQICKAIPAKLPDDAKMSVANAIKYVPELREAEVSPDPRKANTIKYAKKLEGTVRGTGLHACGFIISSSPISDWVPVSTAESPYFKNEKVPVTQYDGHVIESTGLIKMDFLGLKTLSELKEAVKNVKLTRGIDIDLDNIPIDDPKTYALYQQGRTVGTFQFESAGMQKYLRELHPTVFGDLIAMNALYRPGPMDNIPSFIARKNGREAITYQIPVMEKYLKETYGITVYQEQVMLLSRLLAGFTRGQSDSLRKAMGKKKIAEMEKLEVLFYEGGERNGYDRQVLNKIWEEWKKFASYAFNKSHAACYSWVAFQTAYLKANYPAEFMAAIMTRRRSDIKETAKLMDECKAMGIATLGPNVNESYLEFGVNKRGEIRFGLAAINGVGDTAAQSIIDERERHGEYKDVFDFMSRINYRDLNRKPLEALALSGGFDCFGLSREQYFAANAKGEVFLDILMRYGQNVQNSVQEAQNSLFGGMEGFEIPQPKVPQAEPWSDLERLNRERELIGIYLSAHPLDHFAVVLEGLCNTHCADLADKVALAKKQQVTFGGIVTAVKSRYTKTGKPFGVATIEDYDGTGELALFGEDWGKWSGMLTAGASVFVSAKAAPRFRDANVYDLKVADIKFMQTVKESQIDKFTVMMDARELSEEDAMELASMVEGRPGNTLLFFQVRDTKHHTAYTLRAADKTLAVDRDLLDFIKARDHMAFQVN